MTTSPNRLSVFATPEFSQSDSILGETQKHFFRAETRREAYRIILKRFAELEPDDVALRARLARRLKKSPSQITRWLSEPSNLTLDTLSDLLLAMGRRTKMSLYDMGTEERSNYRHHASSQGSVPPLAAMVVKDEPDTSSGLAQDDSAPAPTLSLSIGVRPANDQRPPQTGVARQSPELSRVTFKAAQNRVSQ